MTTYMSITAGGLMLPIAVNPLPDDAVMIDAQWLTDNGPAPYILDEASAYYALDTDVTTDGTAFVFGAKNVTLDLNGHTVTYGNRTPPTVVNGSFESGSGSTVPGWDLTSAPSAAIANNSYFMWGSNVLKFTSLADEAVESIKSDAIAIPVAGIDYTATITIKSDKSDSQVGFQILNANTNAVIANAGEQSAPLPTSYGSSNLAYSCVVSFTPSTTDSVKLVCWVKAKTANTTFAVDNATLTPSRDFGIVATSLTWRLPTQLQTSPVLTACGNVGSTGSNVTIKNGRVVQGQGNAYQGTALYVRNIGGLEIDSVETLTSGPDTCAIDANTATTPYIHHCTLTSTTDLITNRQDYAGKGATITLTGSGASCTVEYNTIVDTPQIGIYQSGGPSTIRYNNITVNSSSTDCYGLAFAWLTNADVSYNTITVEDGKSGRGIIIDDNTFGPSRDVDLHHNTVDIQEKGNREYGPWGLSAAALRLRSSKNDGFNNVSIHDNSFTARTSTGYDYQCIAGFFSYREGTPEDSSYGYTVENNTFKAIVESVDANLTAYAVALEAVVANGSPDFAGNVFESNDTCLQFGGNDGEYVYDGLFVSNEFKKSSEGVSMTHRSISAGYWTGRNENIVIIDPTYSGGATSTIGVDGTGNKDIDMGWLLGVTVTDASDQPIEGATVVVTNKDSVEVFSGSTSVNGTVTGIQLLVKNFAGTTSLTQTVYTPHTLTVTKAGYTPYAGEFTLTASGTQLVSLNAV